MIALLAATRIEARPLIAVLDARAVEDAPFETWRFEPRCRRPGGVIVVSGMGPGAAKRAVEHAIETCGAARIVNVGVCGAFNGRAAPGELFRVGRAFDGDVSDAAPETIASGAAWGELPAADLASVAEPVFGEDPRKAALAARAALVDMEGFAVAQACRERGVPCVLLKGVSDLADRESLKQNLPWVCEKLAAAVAAGLERLPRGGFVGRLLRFAKVEHSILSLPLLLAGAWLGAGGRWPEAMVILWVVVAGVSARLLGMAMNRVLDRRLDLLNPRTAGRELPAGRMSATQGLAVAGAALAVYLLACGALGPLCLKLSPIPAIVLIGYSLLKRFTSLCHFGIGLCLSLGPLAAFVAASGSVAFNLEVLLLATFTFCWISSFDIIYGLQDMESDRRTGVHSLPVKLGPAGAQVVAGAVHLAAAAALVWLWRLTGGGIVAGAALAAALGALCVGYLPFVPLGARFFPTSAVAGIAGALVPLLGGVK